MRGEKPQNRPLSKLNTGIFALRAMLPVTKQRKTIPKQIQNNVLFQTLLHVKQNAETIRKRFGIVLELFQRCFRLINILMHMSKNMQIP